jgi:hypothetical protein
VIRYAVLRIREPGGEGAIDADAIRLLKAGDEWEIPTSKHVNSDRSRRGNVAERGGAVGDDAPNDEFGGGTPFARSEVEERLSDGTPGSSITGVRRGGDAQRDEGAFAEVADLRGAVP